MKIEAKARLSALTEKQKQLDIDGDGQIDGEDLKKVREGQKPAVEASGPVTMTFGHREPMPFKNDAALNKWRYTPKNGLAWSGRIGEYSIVGFQDGDVGVAKIYPSNDLQRYTQAKDSKYYEASKRDRMRQIARAKEELTHVKHPLLKAVMDSAKEELAYYKSA